MVYDVVMLDDVMAISSESMLLGLEHPLMPQAALPTSIGVICVQIYIVIQAIDPSKNLTG